MDWIRALGHIRDNAIPAVIATIVEVRGHSPRNIGAKMVLTSEHAWGSIGGGNMEATVTARAREILRAGTSQVEFADFGLNEHAHTTHGTQCCGGVVQVLLEPIAQRPTVAVFGLGHVGSELARILSRQEIILQLADSRPNMISDDLAQILRQGPATVHLHTPPAPETLLPELPADSHVLILTHDHAEDLTLCDSALRQSTEFASIGVIGSNAKWARFRKRLLDEGHSPEDIDRIQCPIGVPDIADKHPAVIAISVAADLMRIFKKAPL